MIALMAAAETNNGALPQLDTSVADLLQTVDPSVLTTVGEYLDEYVQSADATNEREKHRYELFRLLNEACRLYQQNHPQEKGRILSPAQVQEALHSLRRVFERHLRLQLDGDHRLSHMHRAMGHIPSINARLEDNAISA